MAGLEIRIRDGEAGDAVPLGEIPFRRDAIDQIIPTLQAWGVGTALGTKDESSIYGQFFTDGTRAYFEVVIPD
jgi:hypothetical protein